MFSDDDVPVVTDARPGLLEEQRIRSRRYAWLMGTCLTLFLLAGGIVRLYSPRLAMAMLLVAMVLPPIAAFTASKDVR